MLWRAYARRNPDDATIEKHVPVYTVEGNHVHVVVGD